MTDRTAIDTIRGYYYQFDYSIISLLDQATETNTIIIEGIEDIDIKTATEETAIQCKYYAKTEYNHSVIAEPIRLMLDHFKEVKNGTKQKIKYTLRGFFKSGQHKLQLPLQVATLKESFLKYKRDKIEYQYELILGMSDADLIEFISLLEVDIHAKEFDEQNEEITKRLKSIFKCSNFAAESFFYNNALGVIRKLATQPQITDRTITKKEFLRQINTVKILFNEWFIKLKGDKAHFKNLRSEYFSHLNIASYERFFLIEINPTTHLRSELKEIIYFICRKWSKLTKREPRPVCPYIYIHGLTDSELIELKKEMVKEEFYLNDGFDFDGSDFNPESISRKADANNQIRVKMINSLDFLEKTIAHISRTKEVYQFYTDSTYYQTAHSSFKHVMIQIEKISDIKQIV